MRDSGSKLPQVFDTPVTGTGLFGLIYVNPEDNPTKTR